MNVRGTSRLVLRCSEYDYRNASDSGVRAASAGVVRYLAMRLTFSIPPFLPGRAPLVCSGGKRDVRVFALASANVLARLEPRAWRAAVDVRRVRS